MEPHRPHAPKPTTLESNELKQRALEMVLIIFYMEDLRRFILGAISATDKITGTNRLFKDDEDKKENNSSKIIKKATAILMGEGVLTQEQRTEFNKLMGYRNTIGHEPHDLRVDVGAYSNLSVLTTTNKKHPGGYDSSILERIIKIRDHIHKAIPKKFVMKFNFDSLMFEAAEKTYLVEISRRVMIESCV